MPVTEESRHRLHQKLDEAIGPEEATTLMEHLPPVGWADVATKQDLAHLEERMDQRFALVRSDIDQRFALVRSDIDGRFMKVDEQFKTVAAQIKAVSEQVGALDKRFESLENKMTLQVWQFIGLIGVIGGLILTAAKFF